MALVLTDAMESIPLCTGHWDTAILAQLCPVPVLGGSQHTFHPSVFISMTPQVCQEQVPSLLQEFLYSGTACARGSWTREAAPGGSNGCWHHLQLQRYHLASQLFAFLPSTL